MKKILFTTAMIAFGIVAFVSTAFASTTISFTPSNISVVQGQAFNVKVSIDPHGTKDGTAKIALNYPADLVSVKSFNFSSNSSWFPFNLAGDLIDNTNGVLIKTAGYPGGFSSAKTFGTITFFAKKTGTGTIKINDKTLIYNASTKNVFVGSPVVLLNIKAYKAVTPPTTKPIAKKPTVAKKPVVATTTKKATTTAVAISTTTQTVPQPALQHKRSLLASIGNILTFGLGNTFFGTLLEILVILLVLFGISYIAKKFKKNKKSDSEEE